MRLSLLSLAVTLLIATTAHASVTCKIQTKEDLSFYVNNMANYSASDCPDPDPKYPNHIYLEITGNNLVLEKPWVIPGNVHIKGNSTNVAAPLIIAQYDVGTYFPGKYDTPCILTLSGNGNVVEQIKIDAKTFKTQGGALDNAICIKGDNHLLNTIRITSAGGQAQPGNYPLKANGVHVISGKNNTIRKSIITLSESSGVILKSSKNALVTSQITTSKFPGVIVSVKDQSITANTVTGQPAFYFEPPCAVPVGQAANMLWLNTVTSTPIAQDAYNFLSEACKSLMNPDLLKTLAACGMCSDPTTGAQWKIPYNDDGTCKTQDWCAAPAAPPPAPTPESGSQPPVPGSDSGTAPAMEIEVQGNNQIDVFGMGGPPSPPPDTGHPTPPPPSPGPSPEDTSKPLPGLVPQVNAQPSGAGSCSLIR